MNPDFQWITGNFAAIQTVVTFLYEPLMLKALEIKNAVVV